MAIENVSSKVSYNTDGIQTTFSFTFPYQNGSDIQAILLDTDGDETTFNEGTDYSVSSTDTYSGGDVTFKIAPAQGVLTIRRVLPLSQDSTFRPVSGFPEEVITRSFDKAAMIDQQQQEVLDRCITLKETSNVTGVQMDNPVAGMVLMVGPDGKTIQSSTTSFDDIVSAADDAENAAAAAAASAASAEASKNSILTDPGFVAISNDITGADVIGTVADNLDDIGDVANNISDIQAIGPNIPAIETINGSMTTINTVANNLTAINSLNSNISDIQEVNTNLSDVQTVADNISDITNASDNMTAINTVNANIDDIQTANANITAISNVGGNINNVNAVANNLSGANTIGTVAANLDSIEAVGENIEGINFINNYTDELEAIGTDLAGANTIGTVAANITAIEEIGSNMTAINSVNAGIDDIETVAADLGGTDTIGTVANNISAIQAIGPNVPAISTVNANITDVQDVADGITDIATVADSLTDINNVSANLAAITTVNNNATNINNVVSHMSDITDVVDNMTDITSVADSLSAISTVNSNATNINNVASNMSDIDYVASNMTTIQGAVTAAENAEDAADEAHIWAEGTDSQVQALGGQHSSKGWADISKADQLQANWAETDPTSVQYILNKPEDLLDYTKMQYRPFCVNTGNVDDNGNPNFIQTLSTTTTNYTAYGTVSVSPDYIASNFGFNADVPENYIRSNVTVSSVMGDESDVDIYFKGTIGTSLSDDNTFLSIGSNYRVVLKYNEYFAVEQWNSPSETWTQICREKLPATHTQTGETITGRLHLHRDVVSPSCYLVINDVVGDTEEPLELMSLNGYINYGISDINDLDMYCNYWGGTIDLKGCRVTTSSSSWSAVVQSVGGTLQTQGTFDCSTADGTPYTVSDTISIDTSSYSNGTYNLYVNPVQKTLSLIDNNIEVGKKFSDSAVDDDYLLWTAKLPYSLDKYGALDIGNEANNIPCGTVTKSSDGITFNLYDYNKDWVGVDLSNIEESINALKTNKLNKSLLTNCILEAPNGVFTYSSSSITIKAGLKVAITTSVDSNGLPVVEEYTVPSDVSIASGSGTVSYYLLISNIQGSYRSQVRTSYFIQETEPSVTTTYAAWENPKTGLIQLTNNTGASWNTTRWVRLGSYYVVNGTVNSITPLAPATIAQAQELDGMWHSTNITILNSVTLESSSPQTFDISEHLPDDGELYLVNINGQCQASTAADQRAFFSVHSDVQTSNLSICVAQSYGSTVRQCMGAGAVSLVVGPARTLTFSQSSSYGDALACYAQLRGYRKVR